MSETNLYQTPDAELADVVDEGVGELKLFSAKARIGRMRYIAWTIGLMLILQLFGLLIGVLGGFAGVDAGSMSIGAGVLAMIPSLLFGVLWASQRAHDFNASGWLAILVFVPLVNLIFWFIPGSKGANNYGPPAPENSTGVKIMFWLFIVLLVVAFIGGIVAGVMGV